MNSEIMRIGHPMWEQFCEALDTLLESRKCNNELSMARELLEDMRRFDVDGSLDWLANHGGYCDCEVLMNVDCGEVDCGDPACDGDCERDDDRLTPEQRVEKAKKVLQEYAIGGDTIVSAMARDALAKAVKKK